MPRPRPSVYVGQFDLGGDIRTSVGPLSGEASTESLGFDEETVVSPRSDWSWEKAHLTTEVLVGDFSGVGVADATINLGADPITVGDPVNSSLEFGLYHLRLLYDFAPGSETLVGLGIGAGYFEYDLSIRSASGPGAVLSAEQFPVAYLTGRVERAFGDIRLLGAVSGAGFEWEDGDLTFFDSEAQFVWTFWRKSSAVAELLAGYRFMSIDYELEEGLGDLAIDVTADGPFVGLSFRL